MAWKKGTDIPTAGFKQAIVISPQRPIMQYTVRGEVAQQSIVSVEGPTN
jgi:hypothetical protein